MNDSEHINGKAITDVIGVQPYYFGTVEDRRQGRSLAQQYGDDKAAFHKAMDAAGLQWGDTARLYDDDWSLEALTARQRALARYGIDRQSLVGNTTRYVKERLNYSGLRYDEAKALCEKLNAETWAVSPDPERASTVFGRTMHGIQLERPVPQLWNRTSDPAMAALEPPNGAGKARATDPPQHVMVTSASSGKSNGLMQIVLASIDGEISPRSVQR